MKKLFAISLLSIYLFNLVGYPMLFRMLITQSGKHFSQKIDLHNYLDQELVEVKVLLNSPYITSWGEYQRFEGEITINGVHHNYVKRKVSGDTLYLMCLPNKQTNDLYAAEGEYSKKVNDFDTNKKDGASVKKADILLQYQESEIAFTLLSPELLTPVNNHSLICPLLHSFIELHGKPPEVNS